MTTTPGNASRNLPGRYSVRGVEAPVGGAMGQIVCFLRDGDRVFLT